MFKDGQVPRQPRCYHERSHSRLSDCGRAIDLNAAKSWSCAQVTPFRQFDPAECFGGNREIASPRTARIGRDPHGRLAAATLLYPTWDHERSRQRSTLNIKPTKPQPLRSEERRVPTRDQTAV